MRVARVPLLLALALLAALALAPAARAELGIVGFTNDDGVLHSGKASAVNGPGSGGAAAGDIYTMDGGGFFEPGGGIQQFSAEGGFKRIWGTNVVSSGPGNADETQSVAIFATGGTFTLSFGGDTTSPIAFNASPSAVESELDALGSIGGVGASVSVSGGPGDETGSNPYLVTFGGVQANANQPLIQADGSALTGPGATTYVAATNEGGTGREVCEPENGDTCQGGSANFTAVAIDQASGDVYALGENAVQRFSATGEFKREFGNDVVKVGPDDSSTNEEQQVTVTATGGTFTLYQYVANHGRQETEPIPYNAAAATVESALDALDFLGTSSGGSFKVTGGPGDATGSSPYVITFGGVNAGDNMGKFEAEAGELTGSPKSVEVKTLTEGGGPEVCTPSDVCKEGYPGEYREEAGAGAFSSYGATVALAPAGAPNEGNVVVGDPNNQRVQEFTGSGQFVRAFGWGVVASGPDLNTTVQTLEVGGEGGTYTLEYEGATTSGIAPNASAATVESALNGLSTIGGVGGSVTVTGGPGGYPGGQPYQLEFGGTLTNPALLVGDPSGITGPEWLEKYVHIGTGYEVCVPSAGDVCHRGTSGSRPGQFISIAGVAVDTSGAIYVVDSRTGQLQKFSGSGGSDLTPSTFGENEVQSVKVNAAAGTFKLGIVDPEGAQGEGELVAWSGDGHLIKNVVTTQGEFKVGQAINVGPEGTPGSHITAIEGSTIRLDEVLTSYCYHCSFSAADVKYTAPLPFNATAGEVEAALNALGPINQGGGSVTVSGGPGDAGGTSPYAVSFDGGAIRRTDQPQLVWANGGTPLSGGSGEGANEATISTTTQGGPSGRNEGEAPIGISTGPSGEIFVLKNFPTGWGTCESGLPANREVRVQEYDASGAQVQVSKPCTRIAIASCCGGAQTISVNAANGHPYVFEPRQQYEPIKDKYLPRTYIFGDAGSRPDLTVDPPSNISPTGATISGTINPNGPGSVAAEQIAVTKYRVEYKKTTDSTWEVYAPDVSVGSGTSPVQFSVGISGLTPKATYEARVVVTKPYGFEEVIQTTAPFTTLAAPPQINSVTVDHINADSADFHALINPLGTDTSYHFEYGPTPAYGQSTAEKDIGESLQAVPVTVHVTGLSPIVYHFRVVAKNELGTTYSTDQTFSFYPEPCPNSTVRQQTGSGSLPDCRAYELVSPGDAGAATLLPGGPNSGEATSPPRFVFRGALGSIPGPWNPPDNIDYYVATRTSNGWQTHFVGLSGEEEAATTGPPNHEGDPIGGENGSTWNGAVMGDNQLDKMIGWSSGQQGYTCCGHAGSMAPYVFSTEGQHLGRWPTNVSQVPNALKDLACWTPQPTPPCGPEGGFGGEMRPSGDFTHYFFSPGNFQFAPGGQTTGMTSVYDNNTVTGTVTVASVLNDGSPIPKEPGVTSDDYMALPAASDDGSHILMAASGTGICGKSTCAPMPMPCGWSDGGGFKNGIAIGECPPLLPSHLYMRVNGAVTYDVSEGHQVNFKAMTPDGRHVFFTSTEPLTADDHDSGIDLFMWSEATDSISRVSAGAGTVGDSDACNASWIAKCGVEIASPHYTFFETKPTDNVISNGGDVYFYSPEQFVGSNGIPGRRNLYVLHHGELQYVATLEPNQPATRFEVSPDGRWAAFITASKLTSYDNQGKEEMYRYNADTGDLRCVSCLANGEPPQNNVEGSQDGLFLTDDGRVFFATRDQLVPQDTDGVNDVYEYVDGSARLITDGIATRDETRFGKAGLVGVSNDGTDAYFSTLQTLVPEDTNGAFLKFYDARVNGGFPVSSVAAPCAAADECHGDGNATIALPRLGSTADLGSGGNANEASHRKHVYKKHRRHSRRRHHRAKHRHSGKRHGGHRPHGGR